MSVLLWILGAIATGVAVILVVAATKPNEMTISRTIRINASPERVFPLLNDFHRWNAWSPWEKLDANIERRFSGAESGIGAMYAWKGNKKVGEGEMKIIESTPTSRVLVDLHFIAPWDGRNSSEFTLQPVEGQTEVVWTMRGPSPFMMKVMNVVFSFDKSIGKDFESGLSAMKAAAESA